MLRLDFINLQRAKRLNRGSLNKVTETALGELGIAEASLTFYFVSAKKMAAINEDYMHHEGPTDVITFDYGDLIGPKSKSGTRAAAPAKLVGEIFICPEVAATQSREFRTTWQAEVVRYIIHALLHLCGYDDLNPAARREMKRHENRLVRLLSRRFNPSSLSRP